MITESIRTIAFIDERHKKDLERIVGFKVEADKLRLTEYAYRENEGAIFVYGMLAENRRMKRM